jgi:hypothetical protein
MVFTEFLSFVKSALAIKRFSFTARPGSIYCDSCIEKLSVALYKNITLFSFSHSFLPEEDRNKLFTKQKQKQKPKRLMREWHNYVSKPENCRPQFRFFFGR